MKHLVHQIICGQYIARPCSAIIPDSLIRFQLQNAFIYITLQTCQKLHQCPPGKVTRASFQMLESLLTKTGSRPSQRSHPPCMNSCETMTQDSLVPLTKRNKDSSRQSFQTTMWTEVYGLEKSLDIKFIVQSVT